ncbi:MAG: glycoside hydrolase family 127 protein, partial [Bacteroidales bacterium]|nr:glycoside hydrolase family 127 protein [Bacteroidales bacterium]
VRVPNLKTSELHTSVPELNTLKSLSVNGETVEMKADRGYIAITRYWKKGDHIDLEIPLEVQQITADEKIEALSGLTALRYGPMIYNVEKADNKDINLAVGSEPFEAVWRDDMFKGIVGIEGKWADGSELLAIPNYLRMNRIQPRQEGQRSPESMVWMKQ